MGKSCKPKIRLGFFYHLLSEFKMSINNLIYSVIIFIDDGFNSVATGGIKIIIKNDGPPYEALA